MNGPLSRFPEEGIYTSKPLSQRPSLNSIGVRDFTKEASSSDARTRYERGEGATELREVLAHETQDGVLPSNLGKLHVEIPDGIDGLGRQPALVL